MLAKKYRRRRKKVWHRLFGSQACQDIFFAENCSVTQFMRVAQAECVGLWTSGRLVQNVPTRLEPVASMRHWRGDVVGRFGPHVSRSRTGVEASPGSKPYEGLLDDIKLATVRSTVGRLIRPSNTAGGITDGPP